MSPSEPGSKQLALLEQLLRGEVPTEAELVVLLRARVEEDLHLDYKGREIWEKDKNSPEPGKPNDFKGKLRKHIAGFANGEGGVLIVGITEVDRDLQPPPLRAIAGLGCPPDTARMKARDALQRLMTSGQVRPRIEAIATSAGTVLFVAVPRSDGVVYCEEGQRPVFYVRLHDSTVHAPAYLVEDLVLGRRRRPSLQVRVRVVGKPSYSHNPRRVRVELAFDIENTSLVWAEDTRLALFGYRQRRPDDEGDMAVAPTVREHLRDQGTGGQDVVSQLLLGESGKLGTLPPFIVGTCCSTIDLPSPDAEVLWGGVLVVLCRDQPPSWFQIVFLVDFHLRNVEGTAIPLEDQRGFVAYHRRSEASRWWPRIQWIALTRQQGGSIEFSLREPGNPVQTSN